MRIISIKKNGRANNDCIVSIYHEDDSSLSDNGTIIEVALSMDIVIKEKLCVGKILDNKTWSKIKKEQSIINAKQVAYNYATYSMRTRKQIETKLLKLNFSNDEIDIAIGFLKKFNLSDDKLFAEKFIKKILLGKNVGKIYIQNALIAKGIDRKIAETALEEHYPKEQTTDMMHKLIQKKINSSSYQKKTIEKRKVALFNFMFSHGFSPEDIKEAIKSLFTN